MIGGHNGNGIGASTEAATISGGGDESSPNVVIGSFGTVGGGYGNAVDGPSGTVAGGAGNTVAGFSASGGGVSNMATGEGSTIAGGGFSEASGNNATVGGGGTNVASGEAATVSGGQTNTASGRQSVIPGGRYNEATGVASLAAGFRAAAGHDGSFVWADRSDTTTTFASTAENQFLIRADGGVGIGKADPEDALDVEGNARVTGHYRYGSTRTYYHQVAAAALNPSEKTEFFDGQSQSPAWVNFGTYLYVLNGGAPADSFITFLAGINLPDSVTITAFDLHYMDNDAANDISISAGLARKLITEATFFYEQVALTGINTSGSDANVQTVAGTVTGSKSLIRNDSYKYFVEVRITRFAPNGFSSDLRVYGFTITYTSDRINY